MAFCTLKALAHKFGNVAVFADDKGDYLELGIEQLEMNKIKISGENWFEISDNCVKKYIHKMVEVNNNNAIKDP